MHQVLHRAEMDSLLHNTFLIIAVLMGITCSRADSLTVRVPARRMAAARGHAVVLGCEFSPNFEQSPDLSSLVVTWQRQEDNRVVHSYYYKEDQLDKQDSAYWNRTALFVTELSKGNASVKIENVEMQDAGWYLCTVSTNQGTDKAELQLDYGAFYTEPKVTISVLSSDIVVQYETEGFPAPEVAWKGEDGSNLNDRITTSMQFNDTMGLYCIISNYTTPNTSLNFAFILKNRLLHQYVQRLVSYKGEQKSCFKEAFSLGVISFVFIVTAAIVGWIYYKKKKRENRNKVQNGMRKSLEMN